MDMYPRYQSRSGYFNQDDQTDGYGVDHSGFSLRDELLYQTTRNKREQELVKNYNQRGIDYPQFGSNFWGDSADNYGFGRSNIENNIKKKTISSCFECRYSKRRSKAGDDDADAKRK